MGPNVAKWERLARVIGGFFLLTLVFAGPQTSLGWLGLTLIATGLPDLPSGQPAELQPERVATTRSYPGW